MKVAAYVEQQFRQRFPGEHVSVTFPENEVIEVEVSNPLTLTIYRMEIGSDDDQFSFTIESTGLGSEHKGHITFPIPDEPFEEGE